MRHTIEINPTTLKRLQNYQAVVENERKNAHKNQWMELTLQRMQEYQVAHKKADHVNAVVGYASFLFRVQNGMSPPRALYGEQVLRNALVDLMTELHISIRMVEMPEPVLETMNS